MRLMMTASLQEKLLEKSKEAFLLAIELYNKPTIKYRIEGFSLFICNAWELMLKAHLVRIGRLEKETIRTRWTETYQRTCLQAGRAA